MKKHVWLVLLMLVAALAFVGCGGGGGSEDPADGDPDTDSTSDTDTDTDSTSDTDTDSTSDTDKPDTETDTDTEAEEGDTGDPCQDNSMCAEGLACHPEKLACTAAECDVAADCAAITGLDASYLCTAVGGVNLCLQADCLKNENCPTGLSCQGGKCKVAIPVTNVASVVINEGSGLIVQGANRTLTVTAYTANGVAVSPTPAAEWATSAEASVSVTAGVLLGGATAGKATITATINGKSATVDYTNFPTVAATDSRVVVYNQTTGALVEGAKVYLGTVARKADPTEVVTDANGTAAFAGVSCTAGCNVHVFKDGFTYVTLLGFTSSDIVVPLTADVDNTIADGVKGKQDLSAVPASVSENKNIQIGISMFSIPGNLADLNFTSLIGEMVNTHVQAFGLDQWIGLPSGLEGYVNGEEALKDGFQAVGVPGPATLWGLGGYLSIDDVLPIATAYEGPESIGPILAQVLPYISNFYHGVETGITLASRPKVADVNDINGNESKTDLVADFANFAPANIKITQRQSQSAEFTYPAMPTLADNSCADAVITLVGAMQKGVGFIPLGLTAGVDKATATDTGDCKVGDNNKVTGTYAPQHSGLNGFDYYTVSVALPMSALLAEAGRASVDLAGAVTRSTEAPTTVAVPPFLGFMSNASVSVTGSNVSVGSAAVANASFHRVVLAKNTEGNAKTTYWHIYWGPTATGGTFALPTGIDNRAEGYTGASLAQAIRLSNSADYAGLFSFGDKNVTKMNDMLESFSMHALTAVK